jgi:DNA repair protein RadC
VARVKHLAPADRPREKLAEHGAASLGDNELLAIVIGQGWRHDSALDLANDVLARVGGAVGLTRTGLGPLRRVRGLGTAKSTQILAAVELGRRTLLTAKAPRAAFGSPAEVAAFLMPRFSAREVEQFGVMLLDSRHRLVKAQVLTVGTLDCSVVHPRDVFRAALEANAASVVVFHNHPSGDPTPSPEDVALTRRLAAAGTLLGVDVLDHLVLADASYYSFREAGRLAPA